MKNFKEEKNVTGEGGTFIKTFLPRKKKRRTGNLVASGRLLVRASCFAASSLVHRDSFS
jgi:hypothetical protein